MPKAVDKNTSIAKAASAMYSGADVSQPQLRALEAYVKKSMRAGILKHLACTEKQLQQYATSQISVSELPDKTRERLQNAAKYSKPWPRKTAAMLFQIHKSRKRSKPKPKPSAETTSE